MGQTDSKCFQHDGQREIADAIPGGGLQRQKHFTHGPDYETAGKSSAFFRRNSYMLRMGVRRRPVPALLEASRDYGADQRSAGCMDAGVR